MIKDMIRDLRTAPTQIDARAREATKWVRRTVYNVREQGESNLWDLHLTAIENAKGLLDKTDGVPVLSTVGANVKDLLGQLEATTTAPPLAEYDELNVRKVMAALRDLDHFGLLKVQRYEAANKNRKTILDAIQREFDHRARLAAA